MAISRSKQLAVNTIGALGYISCLLEWLWTTVLYLPSILGSSTFKLFLPPAQPILQPSEVTGHGETSAVLMIVAVIITVIIIAATVYILYKLPVAIAKVGKQLTHNTAEFVMPIVTHHRPVSKKRQRILSARLTRIMKLLIIVLPVIVLLFVPRMGLPLPYDVVMIISTFLAAGSLIWFCLQLLVARACKLPSDQIW